MPAPILVVEDVEDRLHPSAQVSEFDLRLMQRLVEKEEGEGRAKPGKAALLLADIMHRLERYADSIYQADRAFRFDPGEATEIMTAVARLRTDPAGAVEIMQSMIDREFQSVVTASNLAEGLARAERWGDVPGALRMACEQVTKGKWMDAHRVAYASAVARDIPLCAAMLKLSLQWRAEIGTAEALDPYTLVVEREEWISHNSRWFPEMAEAVSCMRRALSDDPSPELAGPLWAERVYALVADDDHDAAIDEIYDGIEAMLDADAMKAVNSLCLWLDPDRLGAEEVVAVLIVTLGAKSLLSNRSYLLERSRPLLDLEEEGVDAVVAGLV